MTETITTGRDIGPLWLRTPDALAGRVTIAPSAYARLSYGWGGGSSDNWDEVACALDLTNHHRRNPTLAQLPTLADFLRRRLSGRRFMGKEFGSWVYHPMHAGPRIVQHAFAAQRAAAEPDVWGPIAAGCRGWLRAFAGWMAWTGCWGPGKIWAQDVARTGPGARLLVGRGAYNPASGAVPYCVLGHKRSWDFGESWWDAGMMPVYLSGLGLGDRRDRGELWQAFNSLNDAVRRAFGDVPAILTPAENQLVLAATRNDVQALEWAKDELIRDWMPAEPLTIIRSEHGVGSVMHEADKAPTATIYYSGWDDDGTTYAAGACNGLRGAHGEQIEAGRAVIDLEARSGWCQRTSGPDRVRIAFPLPKGNLVAVLEAQHGSGARARYYRNGSLVDQAPPRPTIPTDPGHGDAPPAVQPRESFLARLWRRLARRRR